MQEMFKHLKEGGVKKNKGFNESGRERCAS
jgi:hypothetical protein